jgi:cytidylate kinase
MIIAIDGPAGVGKSTVSRRVAEELGIPYINSGNFYRAITYAHLQAGIDPEDERLLISTAENIQLTLVNGRITLCGNDVEDHLHNDTVDSWVAPHSAIVRIRHIVNNTIRNAISNLDAVIEGRDIGTVVYPDADIKVYMDASVEVRALRRHNQGTSGQTLDALKASISARDQIDRTKQEGSLKIAEGALYLDTSLLTIEEVCETVIRQIRESIPQ